MLSGIQFLYLSYIILCVSVGVLTYYKKALDITGSICLVIMAISIVFFSGLNWLLILLIFLILSLAATKFAHGYKKKKDIYQNQRTAKNVISNGFIAFIIGTFASYGIMGNYNILVGGFIGAVATATADTLASEIGVLQTPILITSLKKVEPGTDGGISVLGTIAGMTGALVIGISANLLGVIHDPFIAIMVSVVAGTIGCFIDSLLGAVLERRHYLNNEHVNFLATTTGALVGMLLML